MPTRYFNYNVFTNIDGNDAVTVVPNETIIVDVGASIVAVGSAVSSPFDAVYGIYGGTGSGSVNVSVFGFVFGTNGGIRLDDVGGQPTVFIGQTGRVQSEGSAVALFSDRTYVENAGAILSDSAGVILDGDVHRVLNTGSMTGVYGIYLSSGSMSLVNTGTISSTSGGGYAFIDLDFEATAIWNVGQMFGSVALGSGDDLYQGGGLVTGTIYGGLGRDTIIGGAGDETISDKDDANWLAGGDGADTVEVGVGTVALSVSHAFGGVIGGADTSANDTLAVSTFQAGLGANIFLSTGAAIGLVSRASDNAVTAYINGFENAVGTFNADAIFGTAAANVIEGGNGGDWMVGGGGADRFVFNFAADADAGDQIRDFRRSEADRIDLTGIDANTATTTNEGFVFRTAHTNNAAAEVVITNFGNSARVDLYTNADNIVDGTFVVVYGEAGVTNLQATDFLL